MFRRRKTGAVDIIHAEVPLNSETREALANSLEPSLNNGRPMAVIDLTQVELIDSQGLEEIVEQHEAFTGNGGNLKLAAASSLCLDILNVTGVSDRVELFDTSNAAISSFLKR